MRNIKKLTLSLLAVVAMSSLMASTSELVVNVTTGSSDYDAELKGDMQKTGGGLVNVSGITAGDFKNLRISGGTAKFNDTDSMPTDSTTFDTADNNILEINAAGANVPALTMTKPGVLKCDTQLNLVAAPTGEEVLSIRDAGPATVAADLSASSAPMHVEAGAKVQVGAGVKLPGTVGTVGHLPDFAVDGDLEITAATLPGAIGGLTVIDADAALIVDAGVDVPGLGTTDFFKTNALKFNHRAILDLGDGASWNRPITVGSFN